MLCCTCRSVNGRTFYGVAKEKEEAAKEFEDRISAGENVGLVEARYVYIKLYDMIQQITETAHS